MVSFQVTVNFHFDSAARHRNELESKLRKFLLVEALEKESLNINPQAKLFDTSIFRLDCTQCNDEV